ncbi:hypothetical protein [Polyangium sorediatum]|uniref:PDZ domain-containing protein n=1 Tax=Polyangium sorediatum TaxID=889274 RepID=A0ABT6NKR9_9BACT|nr:hypothetical protein [Polyangium sorediatum]MDI1428904.1 hypothetical protein [Polyangium sorediatum]
MSQVSLPDFTEPDHPVTPETGAALILTSVAMEEMGLAHILNAEGEKIQWILGTLGEGCTSPTGTVDVDDVLAINESVRDTLEAVVAKNLILYLKAGRVLRFLEGDAETGGYANGGKPAPAPAPAPAPVPPQQP